MLTGTILLEVRSERITEINIDGIVGLSEERRATDPDAAREAHSTFHRQLEAIRNISTPEVVVNIRSTGGQVEDALLIHDLLRESGKQITTRCYGYVASAATLIAQAASKGRREMSANGLYLIHQSVTCGEGNTQSLEQTLELLNQTDRRIAGLYAARSGKTDEHFARLMSLNSGNGKWLSAEEAKAAGLIDRITPGQVISNQAREAVRMLRLPPLPANVGEEKSANRLKRTLQRWLEAIGWMPGAQGQQIVISVQPLPDNPDEAAQTQDPAQQAPCPSAVAAISREPLPDNKTPELSDSPLRLKARATPTLPQEDPSQDEPRLSANARAYREDLRQFTL